MEKTNNDIIVFLIVVSIIIMCLIAFVISILYLYRKRQNIFLESLQQLRLDQEKMILSAQLEMQEQTFKHISREIHDNINLSLTLAKLNLNTLRWEEKETCLNKINNSIELISAAISELSDISKSLNADIIIQHGLLKAIEEEINKINEIELFQINTRMIGSPIYMDSQKELIIFRIIQEAFYNIIKHAYAKDVELILRYSDTSLEVNISDNGYGFDQTQIPQNREAGLYNIKNRVQILNGKLKIESTPGVGTILSFIIPIE